MRNLIRRYRYFRFLRMSPIKAARHAYFFYCQGL